MGGKVRSWLVQRVRNVVAQAVRLEGGIADVVASSAKPRFGPYLSRILKRPGTSAENTRAARGNTIQHRAVINSYLREINKVALLTAEEEREIGGLVLVSSWMCVLFAHHRRRGQHPHVGSAATD